MAIPTATFNTADSIFAGLSVIQFTPTVPVQITGATAATDTITKTAHGYSVGMLVTYVSGTGFTGLTGGNSYYVVTAATDTFKISATATGSAISVGTSSAGIFQMSPLVFQSKKLDFSGDQTDVSIQLPDSAGCSWDVRTVTVSGNEQWKFELVDPKRMLSIFGNKLSGRVNGTVILYMPDPDDASGKCALVSESFSCRITRDGGMTFGGGGFTTATINIKSLKQGAVVVNRDAAV